MVLALKVEDGATSQGTLQLLEAGKGKETTDSPQSSQKEGSLADTLTSEFLASRNIR